MGDQQGIAFADQRICEAHIELGQLAPAQRECSNALRIFGEARSIDSLKETQVLQARIFLGFGHADAALATMNEVLDHGGDDVSPRIVGSMYEWRARANAALHNYKEAYADLREYVTRFTAANNAERIRQAGALRARFETDREIERNFSLKRELENTQEQSNRQAQQLRWNTVVAVAGIWIIALLIYFLLANRSYRMQLVQLASQDPLTGLPNRRRTQELALAALDLAKTTGKPLTLALIDMDHFKDINDRCGHAAGDHVLQEFSRAGREALRETDILGRWGGEEFLLLMPDTPVELAVASLERLRTLVFGIRLPPTGSDLQVSLSAGLASYDATVKSFEDFVARADAALYRAKHDGRDLIRLCEADFISEHGRAARAAAHQLAARARGTARAPRGPTSLCEQSPSARCHLQRRSNAERATLAEARRQRRAHAGRHGRRAGPSVRTPSRAGVGEVRRSPLAAPSRAQLSRRGGGVGSGGWWRWGVRGGGVWGGGGR